MTGKRAGTASDHASPTKSEGARTTSHLRINSPTRRDVVSDPDSWLGGMPPSTLPPAPFEREADVSGHEWWLEAHMNAAANVLCLEQHVDTVMDSADVMDIDRVRALIARLGDVRDALYEVYCDAADPRMHGKSTPDGPLTSYITRLYSWCETVGDRLATVTTGMRGSAADWSALASVVGEGALFAEETRRQVRDSVHALDVDFASPFEPLRNLPRDVEQMFLSAVALRDELAARVV